MGGKWDKFQKHYERTPGIQWAANEAVGGHTDQMLKQYKEFQVTGIIFC